MHDSAPKVGFNTKTRGQWIQLHILIKQLYIVPVQSARNLSHCLQPVKHVGLHDKFFERNTF